MFHIDDQPLSADASSTVILGLLTLILDKRKKDAEDFILRVLHVSLVSACAGFHYGRAFAPLESLLPLPPSKSLLSPPLLPPQKYYYARRLMLPSFPTSLCYTLRF